MNIILVIFGVLLLNPKLASAEGEKDLASLTISTLNSTKPEVIKDDNYNPCSLGTRKRPDFFSPSRRVSEINCYEYVWEIKHRLDLENRFKECDEYIKKYPHRLVPHYALVGNDAPPAEYPHMASIGWKAKDDSYKYHCVGTLISQKFVLTAAHCTNIPDDPTLADPAPKVVRLGEAGRNGRTTLSYVNKIIVHPSYQPPKTSFDIALIELLLYLSLSKFVHPACLWTRNDVSLSSQNVFITGISYTAENDTSEIKVEEVDIISKENCDKLLKPACNSNWCGVQDHQLCAGHLDKKEDTCHEARGGFLQMKIELPVKHHGLMSYVVGLPSVGVGCPQPATLDVFTRVSSFIDWIENHVWLPK